MDLTRMFSSGTVVALDADVNIPKCFARS